ncbi:MAG: hypothetical protein KF886_13970 [Candidatus Hydrogenedentes bacterium]|nr:hypothetical protein [Candidatus Hydrogenedentota bacterium]
MRVFIPLAMMWAFTLILGSAGIFIANFVFEIALLSSLVSVLWVNAFRQQGGKGFPFALWFSRPVSAIWLVSVPLAWLVLANALVYLAIAIGMGVLFDIQFPGLPFLPVVVTATLGIALISWGGRGLPERAIAAAGFGGVGLWWLVPRIASVEILSVVEPERLVDNLSLSPAEYGVLGLVATVCPILILLLVRQQRIGVAGGLLEDTGVSGAVDRPMSSGVRAFRSPEDAQSWFEYRRTARRSLFVLAVGLGVMVLSALSILTGGLMLPVVVIWSTSLCLTPLALLFCTVEAVLGVRYRGHVARLSVFDATQPVAIRDAVRLKLGVIVRVMLGSCAVLMLGAVCCVVVLMEDGDGIGPLIAEIEDANGLLVALWSICALILVLPVVAMAALLTMSLGYGGDYLREKQGPVLVFLLVLIAPMKTHMVENLTGWNLQVLSVLCLYAAGLSLVGVTMLSVRRAERAGHCGPWQLIGIAVGWALLLAFVFRLAIMSGVEIPQLPLPWLVFLAGLLCIPIASVALAPLSLAAARHQ